MAHAGFERVFGFARSTARQPNSAKAVTMNALLKLSEAMRRPLEWIVVSSGWLMVIMAVVTTFDVIARKIGVRLPYTKLQELEWTFHASIFSRWMCTSSR